jgi:hypothetical protein
MVDTQKGCQLAGIVCDHLTWPRVWSGAEAEVAFGEFWTRIDGGLVKCWMFVMRLSCSGRAFHVAFTTQGQEAFLQGHVLAFAHFAGVPGRIRYDNLKPALGPSVPTALRRTRRVPGLAGGVSCHQVCQGLFIDNDRDLPPIAGVRPEPGSSQTQCGTGNYRQERWPSRSSVW